MISVDSGYATGTLSEILSYPFAASLAGLKARPVDVKHCDLTWSGTAWSGTRAGAFLTLAAAVAVVKTNLATGTIFMVDGAKYAWDGANLNAVDAIAGNYESGEREVYGMLAEVLVKTPPDGTWAEPTNLSGGRIQYRGGVWYGDLGWTATQAALTAAIGGNEAKLGGGVKASPAGVPSIYSGPGVGWVAQGVPMLTGPVRVGYFGPSTVDNYIGVCDMLSSYAAYPGSGCTTYNVMTPGKMDAAGFNGRILVAAAGISGETIKQSYNRFSATYSAGRKAASDVVKTKPHVVVYRSCAINDIQGYSAIVSNTEIIANTDIEINIVKYFIRNGIKVVFTGPMGYSATVSQELLDVRRDAVVRYLARYKAKLSGLDGVSYLDTIGLSCDASGAMLSTTRSSDGIHLTDAGGLPFGAAESIRIDAFIKSSGFYGDPIFDAEKALALNDGTLAITHYGGNSATGTTWAAQQIMTNVTTAVGGNTTFAFLSPALTSAMQANAKYLIAYDLTIQNGDGSIRQSDDGIKILYRCLMRNAGNADVIFDMTPIYRDGRFCFPVNVPSVAPTLVQIFAQIQTSRAETIKVTVRPVGIYNAATQPIAM